MEIKIALAGNPNSGKTTLFNALTGSNQFVGNWPGVTVEKKEGRLKNHRDVSIVDLPGIYSLSPYTLEEVVARNYLVDERPDAILNIIDGTNLERNLYLTTQLCELGIPVVMAVNMMDILEKNGDKINPEALSRKMGCKVVEISAIKGSGIIEAAEVAIEAAKSRKSPAYTRFGDSVEKALNNIQRLAYDKLPEQLRRWYSVKLFERDERVLKKLGLSEDTLKRTEKYITACEKEFDDESDGIIINERYEYIASVIKGCCEKKNTGGLSTSDKIDRIVTNRFAALPIFAVIMFVIYYVSVTTVGTVFTDWANDGLFGNGWHLFSIGSASYEEAAGDYDSAINAVDAFAGVVSDGDGGIDADATLAAIRGCDAEDGKVSYTLEDGETLEEYSITVYYSQIPENPQGEVNPMTYLEAVEYFKDNGNTFEAPDPADYGIWVPGVPVLIEDGLNAANCADWLQGLILDGIVAGVGSVLGFVPQMLVLFLFLAFLEACGYMSRIAFILDRLFRRFGLSGKSFIPMLIGTGCGVPGIMASRTIENVRDRRMTVMTTTFIPCSAKLPFIAMMAGAVFGGEWWVAPSAYFMGIIAVIASGVMLKKTRIFSGEASPFVMELPAYHMPTLINLLRSMWERGWSFIKKAGTIILLSSVIIWFATYFGFVDGTFRMLSEDEIGNSVLAAVGSCIAWIFAPLGWGSWQAAVASVTGLAAKENIVGALGILYNTGTGSVYANISSAFSAVSGYSFLAFNLLCAPCFAAIGAIRREMNSPKWTWFAVGYQCAFAYAASLMINQFGSLLMGQGDWIGVFFAAIVLAVIVYMIARPERQESRLEVKLKVK